MRPRHTPRMEPEVVRRPLGEGDHLVLATVFANEQHKAVGGASTQRYAALCGLAFVVWFASFPSLALALAVFTASACLPAAQIACLHHLGTYLSDLAQRLRQRQVCLELRDARVFQYVCLDLRRDGSPRPLKLMVARVTLVRVRDGAQPRVERDGERCGGSGGIYLTCGEGILHREAACAGRHRAL